MYEKYVGILIFFSVMEWILDEDDTVFICSFVLNESQHSVKSEIVPRKQDEYTLNLLFFMFFFQLSFFSLLVKR